MGTRATPRARQIAKAHDIDIALVEGTGKSGYVLPVDVEAYLSAMALPQTKAKAKRAKANGKAEPVSLAMASQGVIDALVNGAVLPVSILHKLRFRQDRPTGEIDGEDLLALRPTPVGGTFRSDPSMVSWYVNDRGHFNLPAPKLDLKPDAEEPLEPGFEPDGDKQPTSGFGVTE